MNRGRDQSSLSDVPRRHGEDTTRLVLAGSVPLYRAVRATGSRVVALAAAQAIGVSVPTRRAGVGVAVPGELVTNKAWAWTPGPVYYGASGVLSQTGSLRIGQAISPTELLVMPE